MRPGPAARRFVIMGYNYQRGVGEMLESFGHRSESILEKTFARLTGDAAAAPDDLTVLGLRPAS